MLKLMGKDVIMWGLAIAGKSNEIALILSLTGCHNVEVVREGGQRLLNVSEKLYHE